MRIARAAALWSLVVLVAACGDGGDASDRAGISEGPAGSTFVVTGITEDGQPRQVVPGSQIRLRFERDRLVVTAGCNTLSADYRRTGQGLAFGAMGGTEMGCEPALMDQDAWLAALFERPVALHLSPGKEASLTSGGVVLTLADRRDVSPDLPLVGTPWLLDTLVDRDAASSVPAGAQGRIRFRAGGRVDLYDGCNWASTTVVVDGNTLEWGSWTSTQRGCPDPGQELVQRQMHEVLSGRTAFEITEDTLTLTRGELALGFRARASG